MATINLSSTSRVSVCVTGPFHASRRHPFLPQVSLLSNCFFGAHWSPLSTFMGSHEPLFALEYPGDVRARGMLATAGFSRGVQDSRALLGQTGGAKVGAVFIRGFTTVQLVCPLTRFWILSNTILARTSLGPALREPSAEVQNPRCLNRNCL